MRTPLVIVNFKAYMESLGPAGLGLAMICEEVAEETGASIAIAPAQPDLAKIASAVRLPVLAQHFDPVPAGSRTGWVPLEAIKEAGAVGSLINHSERKMALSEVSLAIELCEKGGVESVVCADTIREVRKVAEFGPDYIAIEPPELIGGNISVTTANPEIVTSAVSAARKKKPVAKVLCGAGVKTRVDVKRALELGTVGVLLASGVVRARDQRKAILDLARGLEHPQLRDATSR